jgi:hypothetical protein
MRGIDLNWAGAERTFLLNIDLLKAVEEKCDAGPAFVLRRLATEQWKVADVYETIRFALEGGGMEKADARKLVASHFADHPLGGSAVTAQTILMAALYGEEEEDTDEGEPKAAVAS